MKRKPRPLAAEDYARLWHKGICGSCNMVGVGRANEVFFALLYLTEARISDLKRAHWSHFDAAAALLTVFRVHGGKKRLHRIWLPPRAVALLHAFLSDTARRSPGPIFRKSVGKHTAWEKVRKRASLCELKLYELRHRRPTIVGSDRLRSIFHADAGLEPNGALIAKRWRLR